MSYVKALLAATWENGDLTALLALADMLDEQSDPHTAELLRLTLNVLSFRVELVSPQQPLLGDQPLSGRKNNSLPVLYTEPFRSDEKRIERDAGEVIATRRAIL